MMPTRRDLLLGGMAACLASPLNAEGRPIALLFIGASWCPVCKAAAPFVQGVADNTGMDLLVASQDNRPIPPLMDFVDARGHPLSAQVVAIPTLLFVHLPTQQIIASMEGFRDGQSFLLQVRGILASAAEAGYA